MKKKIWMIMLKWIVMGNPRCEPKLSKHKIKSATKDKSQKNENCMKKKNKKKNFDIKV